SRSSRASSTATCATGSPSTRRSSRTWRRPSGASGSNRARPRSGAAPTARRSPSSGCRLRTSSRAATTRTASASGSASRTWASQRRRSSSSQSSGPSSASRGAGYPVRMEPLLDRLGRPLETLRISITDRCNFRCVYCMPKEVYGRDHAFLERRALLTFEEIARLARLFARLGVRTIRLTGGEPLVRRDVERLVALLHAIPGLELALTTNGALLTQKAEALARAGLDRVTVSLDSVDDATFRALNDVDFPVQKVLDGIDAAAAAGLPVKVNAVVKRGANDDGIVA